MTTHYDTLKVTRDAEPEVIESAYRALMKKYHPDKTNGDVAATERAKAINAAYDTLRDPDARARYDRTLDVRPAQSEAPSPPPPPRPSQPQPQPSARPPSAPRRGGDWIVSLLFIGLALTVGIGAIGSLGNMDTPGTEVASDEDKSATSEPETAASTDKSPEKLKTLRQQAKPAAETSSDEEDTKCSSERAGIDRILCEDPVLARADARLNEAYAMRLEASADPEALRTEQRQWLQKRDALTENREGLLSLYRDRIAELQAGDLTGLY